MKTYGQLNLQAIMEAENLDFAHWTYKRGQCSCCYGPIDQPAKYWLNGKKPRRRYLDKEKRCFDYILGGKKFNYYDDTKYILFKNANNGCGPKTEDDVIQDYTCISWNLEDMEQVKRICAMLEEQLDDDYVVQVPEDKMHCIVIRLAERLQNGY